jgi:Tfp pilus assembly protein PilN
MISINFASKNYLLVRRARTALIAAAVLLCIVLAGMLRSAYTQRAESNSLDRMIQDDRAADAKARVVLDRRSRLVRDLSAMSGLMELRDFSWTGLLTSLETVVPQGVALTSVDFDFEKRALALNGRARSPEALRTLIVGLEKSPSFKDPFLKHQSLEKGTISFNVIVVYQEKDGGEAARR